MDNTQTPVSGASDEQLMSIDQMAEYLQVPKATIYRWRVNSEGPAGMKLGKHVRYYRSDVDAWLRSQRDSCRAG